MNKGLRLFSFIVCLLFWVVPSIHGQELTTNSKGEKIILYPDGSWKYFNKPPVQDPFGGKINKVEESNPKATTIRSQQDQNKEYLTILAKEAYALQTSLQAEFDMQKKTFAALSQKQMDFLNGLITLTEKELTDLNKSLALTELQETIQLSRLEKAAELVFITEQLLKSDQNQIQQLYNKYETVRSDLQVLLDQVIEIESKEKTTPKPQNNSPSEQVSNSQCQFAFNGIDAITGKIRRTLAPDFLFSSTPTNLRSYFPNGDLITCESSITEMGGGKVFLLLEFTIQSSNANNAFGGVAMNSVLTFRTFEGDQVRLVCSKGDEGHYNDTKNVYTFRAQYPISKGEYKVLSRSEIDQVRVVWKTGFEDYEILNVDFFIKQLNCLK